MLSSPAKNGAFLFGVLMIEYLRYNEQGFLPGSRVHDLLRRVLWNFFFLQSFIDSIQSSSQTRNVIRIMKFERVYNN